MGIRRLRRARLVQRITLGLLGAFLVLGLVGWLGPRTATVEDESAGWRLEVEHATLNRAGLSAPFTVTVERAEGFEGPVTLRVADGYLAAFDEHGLDPQPTSETSGEDSGEGYVEWTFEPPTEGTALVVSLDARVEPGRRGRVDGFVELVGPRPPPRRAHHLAAALRRDRGDHRPCADHVRAVWILVRALGKRELGELSAFELLMLVVIGDLVQQGVTQEDYSMTGALLAVGTITIVVVSVSYLSFRFRRVSEAVEGIPAIVVRDGRFVDEVVHVERVTHNEILEAARQQGIVDLGAVRVGILENDGRFSFLLDTVPASPRPIEQPSAAT